MPAEIPFLMCNFEILQISTSGAGLRVPAGFLTIIGKNFISRESYDAPDDKDVEDRKKTWLRNEGNNPVDVSES